MSKETNTAAYKRGYTKGYLDGHTRKEKQMRYKVTIKRSTTTCYVICPDWEKVQKIVNTIFNDDNIVSISIEAIEEEEK